MNRKLVLKKALLKAGRILTAKFGKVSWRTKRPADLVTDADLASQKAILDIIRRECPNDDFRAEEDAVRDSGAEMTWVIDPLDGTTNYAHGYPASTVSIGVLRRGKPAYGGVYDPSRRELFLAEAGKGAFLDGKRLAVSATPRLRDSLLITGFPIYGRSESLDLHLARFKAFLQACHGVRRSGSAALDMAWVAAGRADGFWESKLSPWDVCAGWLLVAEAGGKVTDFAGKPWRYHDRLGVETLASNGRVHAGMKKLLRGTR
jgi:myo-inositol-1(or 4)-monophosphatase